MNFNKKTLSKTLIVVTMLVVTNILISEPIWKLNQSTFNFDALGSKSKSGEKLPYLPGEVVITFKKQVPDSELVHQTSKLAANTGVINLKGHFTTAKLAESETMEQGLARIKKDPNVESVEPRYLYYKQASAPNDPGFPQLWGHNNSGQAITSPSYTANSSNPGTSGKDMNVLGAWDVTTSCNNTIVAVLDTGVTYTHEDLVGNMWNGSGGCVNQNGTAIGGGCPNHGYDFASGDNNPRDEEGHGTHVAMTIGAVGNNNVGISGVCQSAKIMAVRVLGLGGGTNDNIANGIYFAVRNGAKVINMSLGGSSYSSTINSAIEFARTNDVLVVVAAGNDGKNLNTDGAAYPCENTNLNLICISALDQKHALANFSNYDSNATVASRSADFGAPGTNIYSGYGVETTVAETPTSYANDWVNVGVSGNPFTYHTCSFSISGSPLTLSGLYLPNDCSVIGWNFTAPYANPTAMPAFSNRVVYKNFTIDSAATNVLLHQVLISDGEGYDSTTCYDYTEMYHSPTAGNPFTGGGTAISLFDSLRGVYMDKFCRRDSSEYSFRSTESAILKQCAGSSTCSVGYRFTSDGSVNNGGALATEISIYTWKPTNNAYTNLNGTSMATPNAAGVAALIRSYNQSFTYQDVITKLIEGGVTETALTGTTRYGKAINANASIKHLKQVTGVTAVLQ
ncbi:S8 family serine peptidase [Leptospira kanakyensis]|uniref:Peptidase S8 n=1 Tax=Leptospira kanakyensis TaxID=2484968 RepID=A0A6N4QJL3_9LEPT|nr:S8 family serine peptidase [Leptospira kanakyensis]MCW7470783.1 S8 family serine peptidase [Leptospira kanakyensis]TGK54528.1 peptidase S8 [Leptospira kanakyensis]TGK59004.1 peptidase S8 [Leptospira kanakyensis]TGK75155.1 peptidase S8 [Leptospira kanakyensis]